ncbi:DNA polymerase III subunit gamma/tau [Silvanigrella aquatica]|nr:DNA polymerase III subunit gamma/tau [Silvanigrella aquatica]
MPTDINLKRNQLTDNNEQNYIVLARRTRPQSFSSLVGQEVVSNSIEKMLSHNKIPHAFLFTGTRGTGKTSSARILAKSLCCAQGPTITPCQTCVHCTQITACAHDDILEIDGASHTGVDNIRELREATRFFPNSARYKIFIIDEVHMLSAGAFNALLKTLEEPPPQVVFILATTELHKVPITVRSRCMIFSFKKIETHVIEQHLKNILNNEKIGFEDDAITLIAREAKGSIRDSLSLMEQIIAICNHSYISVEQTKKGLCVQGEEIAEKIFSAICQKNTGEALELTKQADLASLDIATLLDNISQLFRNTMIIKSLNHKERALKLTQLLPKEYDFLEQSSQNLSLAAISEIFRLLANAVRDIARTNAGLAWAEIIIIDCISRADWLSASEIISLISNNPISAPQINRNISTPLPPKKPEIATTQAIQEKQVITTASDIQASKNINTNAHQIDLSFFKKFVALTEQKSKTLAARLGYAKVEHFDKNRIQFSDSPENQSYLSFNEKDIELYWESIYEIQFQNADFIGKYTPKPSLKGINHNEKVDKSANPQNILQKKSPTSGKISHAQKNIMQSFQKYNTAQSYPDKGEVSQSSLGKSVSLSEIHTQEKNLDFLQKEKALLEKDHIQRLKKLATEIQIVSID